MWTESEITRCVRRYDRDLYCGRTSKGVRCIFRKAKRYEHVCTFEDGTKLFTLVPTPEFVFALTHNWNVTGLPRAWGHDAVIRRLREIDAWANARMIEQLEEQNKKVDAAADKEFLNETEAFLADNRRVFAREYQDFNVTSLDKTEKRKRLREKKEEFKIKGSS